MSSKFYGTPRVTINACPQTHFKRERITVFASHDESLLKNEQNMDFIEQVAERGF
jgi:hypothetical protein